MLQSAGPILIIEDNKNIASLLEKYLTNAGFDSLVAYEGAIGLALLNTHAPSLLILDIMLPGMDGWDVCREVRKVSEVPILILTARAEEIDRVLGLSMGADDYVVKPFSPREVVERVKAILRRVKKHETLDMPILHIGRVCLDPEKQQVMVDRKAIFLTPSEYKLLFALMSTPGRVFSREELLNKLYGRGEAVVDRVIDVHIGKLRQKIEFNSSSPKHIMTIRGTGYRFADAEELPG